MKELTSEIVKVINTRENDFLVSTIEWVRQQNPGVVETVEKLVAIKEKWWDKSEHFSDLNENNLDDMIAEFECLSSQVVVDQSDLEWVLSLREVGKESPQRYALISRVFSLVDRLQKLQAENQRGSYPKGGEMK